MQKPKPPNISDNLIIDLYPKYSNDPDSYKDKIADYGESNKTNLDLIYEEGTEKAKAERDHATKSDGCAFIIFDCEMVILKNGSKSLAHLSMICMKDGGPLESYSKYISQDTSQIKNYITNITGIEKNHLDPTDTSYDKETFDEMKKTLYSYIGSNTILMGHDIRNDLKVLNLYHAEIIDTSNIYGPIFDLDRIALKILTYQLLGDNHNKKCIQTGAHDSTEDWWASFATK
jgi:DNA polymerase III alpha subunit (gram-positive type)